MILTAPMKKQFFDDAEESRIVIVDDDPDVLESFKDLLETNGFSVVTAGDAESAKTIAEDFQPDLALLDIRLGRANGVDLVPVLKQQIPGIICVMMTAYAETDNAVQALRNGADDYLFKPLDPAALVHTLERYLQIQRLQREKDGAVAALKESQERYALAAEGSNEGLWDWDIANGMVYLSPRLHDILGTVTESPNIRAGVWITHIHADDIKTYLQAMRAYLKGSTDVFQCEYRVRGKDGTYRWVLDRGLALFDETGRAYRMAGSVGDITGRKETEKNLIAANLVAEQANQSKSAFLATMSHELRTPITAIIGFSEIMRDGMYGPIGDAHYAEYARDIHDSGSHILGIINDILDIAKAEAGKVDLKEDDFDLAALVESCLRLISGRAKEGHVELHKKLSPSLPMLHGDKRRVKQILLNLMSNAVKFTPADGKVTVTAELAANGGIAIEVKDTGIGISADDLNKAFEPFSQVESQFERKHEGTGLGLPLSKILTEVHGGTFDFVSVDGVGTTVTVTFPAARTRTA